MFKIIPCSVTENMNLQFQPKQKPPLISLSFPTSIFGFNRSAFKRKSMLNSFLLTAFHVTMKLVDKKVMFGSEKI